MTRKVPVVVQRVCVEEGLPSTALFEKWIALALTDEEANVLIRLVDLEEGARLNETYRQKEGATNVLSFPFEPPEGLPEGELTAKELGDLVMCAPVVADEASAQHKALFDHWAHLVVHGCLHLQGYDHVDDKQASEMEAKEVQLLVQLGIKNPYVEVVRG